MSEENNLERVVGLVSGQPENRILIVEDNIENRDVLRRLLEGAGFPIRVAQNGAAAIEIFRQWRPVLIWMDRHTPGYRWPGSSAPHPQNGGRKRRSKIVAVTASVLPHQQHEVLAAGLDDFVRKPYRSAEIFTCTARHLGVQYVYEAYPEHAVEKPAPLLVEAVSALPQELREQLTEAVICLDVPRINALIGQSSELNPDYGRLLKRASALGWDSAGC